MPTEPSEIPADHTHEPEHATEYAADHDDAALTNVATELPAEALPNLANIPSTGFHFTPETEEEKQAPPTLAPELVESLTQLQTKRRQEVRSRRSAIVAIVCLLTVAGPLAYLAINGKLTHSLGEPGQVTRLPTTPAPSADNSLQSAILNPNLSQPVPLPATPRPDDPVANDFKNYISVELAAAEPLEAKMMQDFDTAIGKNFKSIAESDRIMREKVVPECRAYVAKVVAIHPKTPEIEDAHNYLRTAARARLAGYEKIAQLTGTKADQELQKGIRQDGVVERTNMTHYRDTLSALAAVHGFKENQNASAPSSPSH